MPGEGGRQAIWTFSASELEPGDLLVSPSDKRIVVKVTPFVGYHSDSDNRLIRYLSLSRQTEREDSYCFLWEHQVIRNGEVIYDADNPPAWD